MQQCQQLPLSSLFYNSGYIPALSLFSSLFLTCIGLFILAVPELTCGMWTLSCHMWDLIPRPRTEPRPPAEEVLSLRHWATREVTTFFILRYTFIFVDQFCFSIVEFITGRQGDSPWDTLLFVSERPTVTSHQQTLEEEKWFVTNHDTYSLLMLWYVNWRASGEICYLLKSSYCPLATDIWTLFLEDLCYLAKLL